MKAQCNSESLPQPKAIRVLLVDDAEWIREITTRFLTQTCPQIRIVATAGDGHEALDAVQTHQPDVVLMDVQMPRMNGLEAASLIKQDFPFVRVVLLSTYDILDIEDVLESHGADAFLPKSRLSQELCNLLQRLCGSCGEETSAPLQ